MFVNPNKTEVKIVVIVKICYLDPISSKKPVV